MNRKISELTLIPSDLTIETSSIHQLKEEAIHVSNNPVILASSTISAIPGMVIE